MKSMVLLLLLSAVAWGADAGSLLRKAIRERDLTTMESLLSAGLDPNTRDVLGDTPLAFALLAGATPAVEMLLTWHADPNAPLDGRETPLEYAIERGDIRVASLLVSAGARVNAAGKGGRTPLHRAAAADRLDILHVLLQKGADPNVRDAEGASPLDDAAWRGSLDVVALLLAHGAHLDDPDTQTGANPLNEAAYRGNTSIVQYLLQLHPDVSIPDKQGHIPLVNALRIGKEDAALLLVEAEPQERLTPEFFGKASEAAIDKDESHAAEALLGRGMPVAGALPSGLTALSAAASAGANKTVRVLLDHRADPNEEDGNGATPLEDAALRGFDAIAGTLIDHGALVNRLNSGSGTTALYAAASFGKANVVNLLLDRGASPGLCGGNRKSPYTVALENGYGAVAAQIQAHGGGKNCTR